MIRKTISVIMMLIIAFSFCGCSKNVEFDNELAEVAELILSEYSDYIVLDHAPDIDDENQTISWTIDFRREYIWNKARIYEKDPYEIMGEIRSLINDYLTSNDTCLLATYRSEVHFMRPHIIGEASVGTISNYSLWTGELDGVFRGIQYNIYPDLDPHGRHIRETAHIDPVEGIV